MSCSVVCSDESWWCAVRSHSTEEGSDEELSSRTATYIPFLSSSIFLTHVKKRRVPNMFQK